MTTPLNNLPILTPSFIPLSTTPPSPPQITEISEQLPTLEVALEFIHSALKKLQGCSKLKNKLSCYEEDQRDVEWMTTWDSSVKEIEETLKDYVNFVPDSLPQHPDFQSITNKLKELQSPISDLQRYFEQCDKLDQEMENVAEQKEDLFHGLLNFTSQSYLNLIQQIRAFQQLPQTLSSSDVEWQKRFERKSLFQINYAIDQIEELTEELYPSLEAEIDETKAQFQLCKNRIDQGSPENLLESIQTLHRTIWGFHQLKQDLQKLLSFHDEHASSLPEACLQKMTKDRLYLHKLNDKLNALRQHFSSEQCAQQLFSFISQLPSPKENILLQIEMLEKEEDKSRACFCPGLSLPHSRKIAEFQSSLHRPSKNNLSRDLIAALSATDTRSHESKSQLSSSPQ